MPPIASYDRYLSERVNQLRPSSIRRFFELAAAMDNVISLTVGEPDFHPPRPSAEAAIATIAQGPIRYTQNLGLRELRDVIAANLEQLYGVRYDPANEILVTIGASEGLDLAFRSILNPGDEVLIPDPWFVAYPACATLAGATPVAVPTDPDRGFTVAAAELAARITPRTRAILLGSPNNPTGAVFDRAELEQIARLATEHDLLVVSDEIYARLVYGVEQTCFPTLLGMRERTILLNGFSKAYAMTGWRIGYACAPASLIGAMVKIHIFTAISAPVAGQVAAMAAMRTGEDAVRAMVAEYDARRHLVLDGLRAAGLPCPEPHGAFYAFPSVAETGLSDEEFAERLLMEKRVATVPGSGFGELGQGRLRLSYATSRDQIQAGLDRIAQFVQEVRHAGA